MIDCDFAINPSAQFAYFFQSLALVRVLAVDFPFADYSNAVRVVPNLGGLRVYCARSSLGDYTNRNHRSHTWLSTRCNRPHRKNRASIHTRFRLYVFHFRCALACNLRQKTTTAPIGDWSKTSSLVQSRNPI